MMTDGNCSTLMRNGIELTQRLLRFFSDYYAFNYLLRGQGESQTWMTTESPQAIVAEYKVSLSTDCQYLWLTSLGVPAWSSR